MAAEIELATGVVLLVYGISYLLNAEFWAEPYRKVMAEPHNMLVYCLVSLVLGMIMVRGHNLWVADWRVAVTIIGWATLVGGALLLLQPGIWKMYADLIDRRAAAWIRAGGTVSLIVGGVVTYMSWPAGG